MEEPAIRHAIVEGPLGRLLVAGTGRGVCNVRFGGDAEQLVADLAAEFPFAHLACDTGSLDGWVEALLGCLHGELQQLELPLDVRGSRFQQRVWDAIRRIPYGGTRSYAELAADVGRPRAVRAVASACAANPTPLAVPCHRVVRSDGGLGGYRYGAQRKRWLLETERAGPDRARQSAARCAIPYVAPRPVS